MEELFQKFPVYRSYPENTEALLRVMGKWLVPKLGDGIIGCKDCEICPLSTA